MDFKRLVILYGSQTGYAEDLADRISRQARSRHIKIYLSSLDEYSIKNLINEDVVLFVCSTTGQGDPPDNMQLFWKFIMRRGLPNNSLINVKFAVLGLGDSSYEQYNFVAKKLHKRLLMLGGNALVNVCLGDDQHDLGSDAAVEPWLLQFWETLGQIYSISNPNKSLLSPKYDVSCYVNTNEISENFIKEFSPTVQEASEKKPYKAELISNDRVTKQTHFQDVRLIKFSAVNAHCIYKPGDVLMIQPENTDENVDKFFEIFNCFDRSTIVECKEKDGISVPDVLKGQNSLENLVKYYFDFCGRPKRSFFEILSKFSTSELEKEKLEEFDSAEGQEELFAYCNRPRRTYLEVLQDFPETLACIEKEYFFDLFPPLKPRAFSIASSPKYHKNELHILVAVVRYKTRLFEPRKGVCSTWLAYSGLKYASIWIKKGTMMFPRPENVKPCIMVGPGTGVAPFRSYLLDMLIDKKKDNLLFFGSRNEKSDFFFKEDWENCQKENILQLRTAFSRDQDDKIYVQHRIRQEVDLVCRYIYDEEGSCYIAGNSNQMPEAVKDAVKECLIKGRNLTKDDADTFISNMIRKKLYQLETWS
ncbi:DgyrCDS8305 [Dimorphilus gyrociliatus]|uniref:NADPH-dependent diflavin oxidoreductase 1 n=1 Tax=Dimorphilus gyrociliatus TaxID=2664684 RepID=A0A7I8VTR8_9ANNE|nr:DgyrCDS8305 [Dimorphilus gyrociliatus]